MTVRILGVVLGLSLCTVLLAQCGGDDSVAPTAGVGGAAGSGGVGSGGIGGNAGAGGGGGAAGNAIDASTDRGATDAMVDVAAQDALLDAGSSSDGSKDADTGVDVSKDVASIDATSTDDAPDGDASTLDGSSDALADGPDATSISAPSAPTGITAVAKPGGIIELTWVAPSDGGSPITGYAIESSPAGFSATTTMLTRATTPLTIGTSYTFSIRATNGVGPGPAGISASVVAGDAPGPPTNVVATAPSGRGVATWTAANPNGYPVTSYDVVASPGGASAQVNGSASTATVIGLTNGVMYTLTVRATNALGIGPGAQSNAITGNCASNTHTLNAVDTASVQYGTPALAVAEPSVFAYRRDSSDLRGWAKFSLASVPLWARITSMTLEMKVQDSGGSPTAILEVWYSSSDGWSRAMIPQPADIAPTLVVSPQQTPAVTNAFQAFGITVGARDWSGDVADRYITLGVRNTAVPPVGGSSYAQYFSSDIAGNRPFIILGVCE